MGLSLFACEHGADHRENAFTLGGELRSTSFSDPVPECQEGGVPKEISHEVVPSNLWEWKGIMCWRSASRGR